MTMPLKLATRMAITAINEMRAAPAPMDEDLFTRINIARRMWMRTGDRSNIAEIDRFLDEMNRRRRAVNFSKQGAKP